MLLQSLYQRHILIPRYLCTESQNKEYKQPKKNVEMKQQIEKKQ